MKNYIYRLDRDYSFKSKVFRPIPHDLTFYCDRSKLRLAIATDGEITIMQGYAWDGCSPKIKLWDVICFGTPDGLIDVRTGKPATYYASLVHDALGQFAKKQPEIMPYDRDTRDRIFHEMLGDFVLADLYYWAVKNFGWLYDKLTAKKR